MVALGQEPVSLQAKHCLISSQLRAHLCPQAAPSWMQAGSRGANIAAATEDGPALMQTTQ